MNLWNVGKYAFLVGSGYFIYKTHQFEQQKQKLEDEKTKQRASQLSEPFISVEEYNTNHESIAKPIERQLQDCKANLALQKIGILACISLAFFSWIKSKEGSFF